MNGQPSVSLEALKARAELMKFVREFFYARRVLEVETPLLMGCGGTDPYLDPVRVSAGRYLQTSPEYAMKRLLAAGSGDIFQICKAFREGDLGPRHNPEFTILEWYRIGLDDRQLMDEVAALVGEYLGVSDRESFSYRALFQHFLHIDPWNVSLETLQRLAKEKAFAHQPENLGADECLNLLMGVCIEPQLPSGKLVFVHDYPPGQAALARIRQEDGVPVGARFELYVNGIELANGYHELQDAAEQARRFAQDNHQRRALGKPEIPVDVAFLAALESGLPACAGVALGLDRLLMLKLGKTSLDEILFRAENPQPVP